MQFATTALFLLVILLPGFILQTAYTKGFWRWNSPSTNLSITERIPSGIVLAGLLHFIWFNISQLIFPVDVASVLRLLLGEYGHQSKYLETSINSIALYPKIVFLYFSSLSCFAALVGYGAHSLVRKMKWDLTTRFLRFNNEWYYWLFGEATKFPELKEVYLDADPDGVVLTSIVHHGNVKHLYQGIIFDFFFDTSGDLDRVLLINVSRRDLVDDKPSEGRYYDVKGDLFVLRYSEMVTININYLYLEDQSDE